MSGQLERLLAEATPGPWEYRVWGRCDVDEWPDSRVSVGRATQNGEAVVVNPRYGERTRDLTNARLIALAPDLARLLVDAMAWVEHSDHGPDCIHTLSAHTECGRCALLARFAVVEQKAGEGQA